MKTATSRRVYYDFADMLRTNPTGNVPYTPILVRRGGKNTRRGGNKLGPSGWVVAAGLRPLLLRELLFTCHLARSGTQLPVSPRFS